MPDVSKQNGIEMADIAKINEQDVPSGGGASANALATSGVQLIELIATNFNTDLGPTFGRGPSANHTFQQIATNQYWQFWAVKSDGTLWYFYPSTGTGSTYYKPSGVTADATWRQYGSDTDWEMIGGAQNCFGALKDGDYWFLGQGSYRQRGDGSTSSTSNWLEVNSSGNWTFLLMGYRHTWLVNSSGEAYSTGYGYNYMSGQGSTGTVSTFTRESASLSNIVEVAPGYRSSYLRNSSGDVYMTGNDQYGKWPQQTSGSTSSVNGPTLAISSSSDYVCGKLGKMGYSGGCNIDTDGYLRFHGNGFYTYLRPDNVVTPSSDANKYWNSGAGLRLDSLGTGWVDYNNFDINSSSYNIAFCVNSDGSVLFGGNGAETMKATLGLTVNKEFVTVRSANGNEDCCIWNKTGNTLVLCIG